MAAKKKATKKAPARSPRRAQKKSVRKTVAKKVAPAYLRIGQRYPEHGGVFVGITIGETNAEQFMVFRGRMTEKDVNHAGALQFAANCADGGFKDWEVPGRNEGALLYANDRDAMRPGWHWLKPQLRASSDYAWVQTFRGGNQTLSHKSHEFPAVLVRRVPI